MILEAKGLSFIYPPKRILFHDASLSLSEGEIISVLGRNGAGKTTLLNCLLGRQKPAEGEIFLKGQALQAMKEREISRLLGFVPQNSPPLFDYTVLDYVVMGCAASVGLFSAPGKKEYRAAEEALEELDVLALRDRPFTELSGGEAQQVTIARAICSHPAGVLFDEPTSHLDYPNQIKVLRTIKKLSELGYGVMLTTHNPDHALLLGGKAVLLGTDGSLCCGAVEEVITSCALSEVYDSDVRITWVEEIDRMACLYPGM